jgi:hypothetical protein
MLVKMLVKFAPQGGVSRSQCGHVSGDSVHRYEGTVNQVVSNGNLG